MMSEPTALDHLIRVVCVDLGWCGSVVDGQLRHVTDFLPNHGDLTADEFVKCLFRAEGMDPKDEKEWQGHSAKLRDAFIRHLGSDVVDVGWFTNP